jgi:Uncharacterised protein conserved in bacteria (DUF2313)
MKWIGTDYERSVKDALISYRPKYYEQSKVVNEITRVDAEEIEELYTQVNSVLDQFFIEKATWGLDMWERTFNIQTDETKSYEERRGVLKSIIRRYGTSTKAMIKNVAESYLNGEVEITEHNDEYYLNIKFVGKRGVPSNLNDIKKAIREVTPAHLGLIFELTYVVWRELENQSFTFNDTETKTWDQLEKSFL